MAGARWGMPLAGIAAAAAALSGCSMGSMFGGGQDNLQLANANATPAQIAQGQANALPSIATSCPPVKIMPGAQALFYYGGGKAGNPDSLHYETSFDQETRNCVVSNGLITVKMGVSGRVLLGPAGKETSVKVPIRVTVDRNDMSVFSEKYVVPVAITPPAQSAPFVKVIDNISIPYLNGDDIVIWVGFDSGK
jgi:hypothetical protein